MKKSLKQILSLALTVMLVLGSIPCVFAEETDVYLVKFDFTNNISGWDNASNKIAKATDPLDSDNGVCAYPGKGSSTAQYINARAFFDDTPNDDKIFTGRVMLSNQGETSYDYRLRGGANISLVAFDKGGSIKVRDAATGLIWKPNTWISFSVYVVYSNDDKTICPVYVSISSDNGMIDSEDNVVNTYYDGTKTIDMSGYASNFGATAKDRNSINAQTVFQAGATSTVYMDDVNIIIPAAPVAQKENVYTTVEYIDSLDVSFNHQMDMSTFKADNFVLTAKDGTEYKPNSIAPDYVGADSVKLTFATIDTSGEYTLDMSGIKDISGTSVSNSLMYTVENVAAEPITDISITTDGVLEQVYDSITTVEFTAVTTPATGVRTSTIGWYVNDVKQETVGVDFLFTPDRTGMYYIYAAVDSSDVKSNRIFVNVSKADPVVKWPTVSVIYEGYAIGDALNNDGSGDGVFTIEDADVRPSANADGYLKNIIFTPTDKENYNVIYKSVNVVVNEASDMAYDTVTITNDSASFMRLSQVKTINYTADAQPSIGPDVNSIIWYVNGEKQSVTGKTFSFTPDKVGSYYVSVSVENNAAANVTGNTVAVLPDEEITANNSYYITDDFSSGNLNKWTNVSGKEPGSGVKVSADPYDENNKVADYYAASTGSTFIGMRKVMDAANPLVMSGRVMLYAEQEDNGAYADNSFSILLRSMVDGYGSYTILAFNQNNTISLGGQTVGKWLNNNKWIDFAICLVPNGSDPTKCTVVGIFNGAVDVNDVQTPFIASVTADYSNFAFDDPQVQFNSVIRPNKDARNHVYLDDFKGYSTDKFKPVLLNDTNVGAINSLLIMYNHPVNPETVNENSIKVYDNETMEEVKLLSVESNLLSPNYTCLNFIDNLKNNTIYRIDFSEGLKDIAGISSCYNSVYFSTGSMLPPEPIEAEIKVNRISVYPEYFELPLGFALPCELAVTVTPDSATNPTLRWTSSNESVATVENGIVTGVSLGEVEIQAFATDGSGISSNVIKVKITESRIAADNQKINLGAASGRIDVEKHLSMPENIGEGQVALWNDDKTGAITITVDDCITGDFAQWMKWTEEYGFVFTFFIPTKDYGTSSWPKAALEELLAAGEDVQSHTYHHYDDITINAHSSAQSILEFKQPIEAINSLEGGSAKALAYSYGTGDSEYAAQFYIAARGVANSKLNSASGTNYKSIYSISMNGGQNITEDNDGNISLESAVKSLYDKNYKYRNTSYYGGWTCFHTHGLGSLQEGEIIPDQGGLSTADSYKYIFDNYMYPAKDKLWIDTFANVAMYAQERDTATLTMLSSNNSNISYSLTDEMDDNLFNYPLTVKIKVDPKWNNITATQNGLSLELNEVVDGGDKYVFVKTVPDRGVVTLAHDGSVEVDCSVITGMQCYISDGKVKLTSVDDDTVNMFVVTYDDNNIVENITATEITLKKDIESTADIIVPEDTTNKKVKLIIWKDDMQAIILPIEF